MGIKRLNSFKVWFPPGISKGIRFFPALGQNPKVTRGTFESGKVFTHLGIKPNWKSLKAREKTQNPRGTFLGYFPWWPKKNWPFFTQNSQTPIPRIFGGPFKPAFQSLKILNPKNAQPLIPSPF